MYQRTVQWAAACCRNFQNVLHRMQVRQDETLAKEGCMYVHEAASAPQMLKSCGKNNVKTYVYIKYLIFMFEFKVLLSFCLAYVDY